MNKTPLQLVKKDTKTYSFTIKRNDVAVDISGWTVYFTVKQSYEDLDENAIITKNYTFPSDATSVSGIGYLALTSDDLDVDIGNYVYDMKFVDTGYRETFLYGKINIIPSARLA